MASSSMSMSESAAGPFRLALRSRGVGQSCIKDAILNPLLEHGLDRLHDFLLDQWREEHANLFQCTFVDASRRPVYLSTARVRDPCVYGEQLCDHGEMHRHSSCAVQQQSPCRLHVWKVRSDLLVFPN